MNMLPPANIESLGHSVGGPRLTQGQLEILQHALGVDQYGQGQMYRNYFCAEGRMRMSCRELRRAGIHADLHPVLASLLQLRQ